jgi:hypothetical protein
MSATTTATATNALLENIQWAHQLLTIVTTDLTPEQAHWQPPGTANSIAATYAHAICSEDAILHHLLLGRSPLFAAEWAGRSGISDPQWASSPDWARAVRVNLPALHDFASAVAGAAEAHIGTLTPTSLERMVDLSANGLGHRTVSWIINALLAGHLHNMAGEISCLKGLQGAQGYPF